MDYFKDKNILIIGSSSGIGNEIANQIKSFNNYQNLFLAARSYDDSQLDDNMIKCDISKIDDLQNLYDIIFKKINSLDIIIFSAAIYHNMNYDNFDLDKSNQIIDVNFKSFLSFISIFKDKINNYKINHIAVISSVASYFGMYNSLSYGASKAALSHFTESLYYELQKYNVKIQLIHPGFVKTRLTAKNDFKMPFIISSEKAANIIINNLPKNKFEIYFPYIFAKILKILQILPYNLRLKINKLIFKNDK